MNLSEIVTTDYAKPISECSNEELYRALLKLINRLSEKKQAAQPAKKKLYYISAEFLIGKLLSNNLINLGIYDEIREELEKNSKKLSELEELEREPSLGNGGLGRLAACFLDSIATLSLCGDGVGLNYHFGLFRQVFKNNEQTALPDNWITEHGWLIPTDKVYPIEFRDRTVQARMYDINITGFGGITNRLHLFDIESADESIVGEGINFDKTDIEKNLTLFLYPDDSDDEGRLLRIYQQYFLCSAAAQLILEECISKGCKLYDLPDYAVIQINDTHPTMIIPELIRLLTERGMLMDDAIAAVSRSCAYTNHTILAEALEKWPIAYFRKVAPRLVPILEVLDDKVRRLFPDPRYAIIDGYDTVHMAHLDIHCTKSVNGVASLHTEILKKEELAHFYALYPEKFNNKTNGITFRRWLLHANPSLAAMITELIGEGYKSDSTKLEELTRYKNDTAVLERLLAIKSENKARLQAFLSKEQNLAVDRGSIFDIQIKRLHEYKRQQLNLLYVIHKYLEIMEGKTPSTPVTVLFGAKAAPAYVIAQDIIHCILCMQELIASEPRVQKHLNVLMVENYNVTAAEQLIPACDISEQISLASKEASGTGNMKFMLNGALTLGTEDGANVEIHRLVGDENIYIFGASSEAVVERYKSGSYNARSFYGANPTLRRAVDFITDDRLTRLGSLMRLERLSSELKNKDWFMTFLDFDDYVNTRERAYEDYENRIEWARKMLINIAMAGYFSSDRAIAEYNRDIWKLEQLR